MNNSLLRTLLPLFIIIIAGVLCIVLISLKSEPEREETPKQAFLVEAHDIFAEDIEFLVYAQGSVQPKNKTMLSSQVSGTVVAISDKFIEGGFFNKGDVLVELESDDYKTGLLLAQADLARAEAALNEEIARGRVAEREWSSVNSGTPPELGLRKPQLAREQANVKAAKASLARAERNLSRTKIRAPYTGLVKSRLINLGQFLGAGSQVGEVFSTDIAQVRLPLTDNDVSFIGDITSNQPAVSLRAEVAGKMAFWQGTLVRDEAVLDEARRVTYGVVEVKDPYNLEGNAHKSSLKFGRFVSAEISGIVARGLVKLPREVIRLDGTILTVNDDMQVQINQVEVIRADEDFVYISGGLPLNQKVITSAIATPFDGMPVRFTDDEPTKAPASEDETDNKVAI